MSVYISDLIYDDYLKGFHTDKPLTKEDLRKYVIEVMYDDPVAMEELALLALQVVNWERMALQVNHEAGVS